jgi:hypothetical protein
MAVAEIEKVTDPTKMVTDPVVLDVLAKQKIDKDYVLLLQDYGKCIKGVSSPYARFYHDLKSGKRLMVTSGLPMVDAYGFGHELKWTDKNGIIENGNNIFHSIIDKGTVRLIALSDQPTLKLRLADQPIEIKKDDELIYHPQLFIGGVEMQPLSLEPSLRETDPVNPNYHDNVLEWDYGVCKRRIRIIEGRYRERWIFDASPDKDIRIKHNFNGSLQIKIGNAFDAEGMPVEVMVVADEEIVAAADLKDAVFPIEIGASATFYPDANPETSSVDGYAYTGPAGESSWSTLVARAGNAAVDSVAVIYAVYIMSEATSPQWRYLYRSIFLFDTSSLPDDAVISAATLSLYGKAKYDNLGISPNINVYLPNPASNTALVAADFNVANWGSTPLCDSPIPYAGWNLAGYNNFALNAAGLAAINKTGISKFGTRNVNYDVAGSTPAWSSFKDSSLETYGAEQGSGYKPKLVVTYEEITDKTSTETGSGLEVSLATAALISGDSGAGADIGGLWQGLSGGDTGEGSDAFKALIVKAGSDTRLPSHQGQVARPNKEVSL